jgi:hypothetical protein
MSAASTGVSILKVIRESDRQSETEQHQWDRGDEIEEPE